ncbi:MAG: FAD-dependent oxidoreductase [Desulfobacterales bacterium]|nr:FAD-dependent oxidoreductase [Desulfobacterales bacterium]
MSMHEPCSYRCGAIDGMTFHSAVGGMFLETQVLIIGGGITGVGLARDLALRGVHSVLVERRDIAAGASGANHGLLHSGARYVRSDPVAAVECREESALLKRLAGPLHRGHRRALRGGGGRR